MRLLKNRESGQALVMVLIVLVLGSLLVIPALTLASTSLEYHGVVQKSTLETYAADSGVQYALCELGNNPREFVEELPSEVNGRTVNVTVEYMGGDIYKITSTATSVSGSITTIESYVHLRPYAIIANSTEGILTARHDTITNGDIYYTGVLEIIDNAVVYGEIIDGYPIDLGIDPEEYKAEAQSGGTHEGDLIINSSPYSLGPLHITGKLTIEPGMNVTLGGTVYVDKNINIKDDVIITGTGNLLSENQTDEGKSIEIHKRVTISCDNLPLIMVVGSTKELKVGDGCDITGILYAPNGKIHFHARGPSNVYGVLIGRDVRICEDATVTSHPDLHELIPYLEKILTWQVN